jgi:hypothetical protein
MRMLDRVVCELLGVLAARAERLSWWAYDQESQRRLAFGRRRAAKAWTPQRTLSTHMPRLAVFETAPVVEAPNKPALVLAETAPILVEPVPAFDAQMRAAG